jgi:O-Antigen ligase
MPVHLRALVVILAAAMVVFLLAEKPLCPATTVVADYRRRRNAWFAVTLIGFLAHNFWLYALLTGVLVAILARRDRNPLALFFLLLFAIPAYSMNVPGFGLINYLFTLNHVRLLSLAILLPLSVALMTDKSRDSSRGSQRIADVLVAAYLLYAFMLQAAVDSVTGLMRGAFGLWLDVWLPYYVASRALHDLRAWREVCAAFALAAAVMAVMAPFEAARGWLLYTDVGAALGIPNEALPAYILRGEGGALRANVAAGNSIVLGYVMMVALLLSTFLAPLLRPRARAVLAVLVLVSGLVAALARGPWVGAAVGLVVALGVGIGAARRLSWLATAGAVVAVAALLLPGGEVIIDHLPFVGSVEEGSVTYRQRLFEVSMGVLWQNPVFGSFDYLLAPSMEEMRQGQGIIDMVNTYLAVALPYGLVGLFLFICPFAYSLLACWRARVVHARQDVESDLLGRALAGAMVAILVTIATVSSIGVVPVIYWMLAGLCVGYARMVEAQRVTIHISGKHSSAGRLRHRPQDVGGVGRA